MDTVSFMCMGFRHNTILPFELYLGMQTLSRSYECSPLPTGPRPSITRTTHDITLQVIASDRLNESIYTARNSGAKIVQVILMSRAHLEGVGYALVSSQG